MYSSFIVNRPVLSIVISVVIITAGLVCMQSLPVSLYPDIAPPTITVSAVYPGANAQTLADTVAQPIEEQVNGVEGMRYMSSNCSADGTYTLTVTFDVGLDLDMCQVLVQNRVSLATPKLPTEVKQQGVNVNKKSTQFVIMASLYSEDKGKYDDLYLSNYATIHIKDVLSRVEGVGEVDVLGAGDYSMRVWLKPDQLKHRKLVVNDVIDAIKQQNVQVAAGIIGQPPAPAKTPFQYTVTCQGRLQDVEEFRDIILKTGDDGQIVRIRDVAEVQLGAQSYSVTCNMNGKPTTIVMVYQLATANTVEVSRKCREALEELKKGYPDGLAHIVAYDGAWYINASIKEIYITLLQAVGLVILIVFVFLQDWRASLIPSICVPVSLIGTFIAMTMLGFTINTMTLFGLILAIGVVVDDSIVVVENTQRHIEAGKKPHEAAILSMNEVIGPCIATTLTLLAVFVPTAFLGGLTGRMYQQFALTVSASVVISTINALTLSPVLCSLLLRPASGKRKNIFFRGFDRFFGAVENGYYACIKRFVRRGVMMFILFAGVCAAMGFGFMELPTGFVPIEDQGYFLTNVQLPDAASLERSETVSQRVQEKLNKIPGVKNVLTVNGLSFLTGSTASNYASFFIFLDPWDQRKAPNLQLGAIVTAANKEYQTIPEAIIFPIVPPAIQGIGNSGGFSLELQDRGNLGPHVLQKTADDIVAQANQDSELQNVFSTFRAEVPQVHVKFEKTKIMTMGLNMNSIYNTLQGELGSIYVNDFNKFGRTYQVNIQADASSRAEINDIGRLWDRNASHNMVPLDTVTSVNKIVGPQVIYRYNMFTSTLITGSEAENVSSGEAMDRIAQITKQTAPASMGFEWTAMSYEQVIGSASTMLIFLLGAFLVYLFLAAQYESFLLPIAVILSVPFALVGALGLSWAFGLDNNLYTQIGIVILIGLASKTSILIVEFAKQKHEHEGLDRFEAAALAAKQRFRAILMTAFSDIFGWIPLLIATGAGAASRVSLGTAVVGGMILACGVGILFVPTFYVVVQKVSDALANRKENKPLQEM